MDLHEWLEFFYHVIRVGKLETKKHRYYAVRAENSKDVYVYRVSKKDGKEKLVHVTHYL